MALEKSGLNYVIVRPGGMERPTDSYKETHNVRLCTADTLFGGQVRPGLPRSASCLCCRCSTSLSLLLFGAELDWNEMHGTPPYHTEGLL